MEVTISYNGQAVATKTTLEVYEFLDRTDHKTESLLHEQRRYWDGRESDEYIIITKGVGTYSETSEKYLCRMEALHKLMAVLDTCTGAQRRRFLLYALDRLSFAEIGVLCGCSRVTVYQGVEVVKKKFINFFENRLNGWPVFRLPSKRNYFPYLSEGRTADELPASPIFRG